MVAEPPCLFEVVEELEYQQEVVVEISEMMDRYPLWMMYLT